MSEHYAYLLNADGTRATFDKIPTLKDIQKYVGGNIEMQTIEQFG